jgi:hypothetical protein
MLEGCKYAVTGARANPLRQDLQTKPVCRDRLSGCIGQDNPQLGVNNDHRSRQRIECCCTR